MGKIFGDVKLSSFLTPDVLAQAVKARDIPHEFFQRRKRFRLDEDDDGLEPDKKKRESVWQKEREYFTNKMPKLKTKRLETPEGCIHDVTMMEGVEYKPWTSPVDHKPAKEYPFVLDPFQKEAIACIESNESVLVSAHTSAGKTVVAEYAIALALRNKQSVIYTTPIKALSNQKYSDFKKEFDDVGLMTGDITLESGSKVIVMTTEILRKQLQNGIFYGGEPTWIIFDEIHYMRDTERGVAWEESIIMLKPHMRCVFLSATIPNAKQFSEWICFLHKEPCHVVYTDYRPTPLMHYVYPEGGSGIYLVVDEKGNFKEDNLNEALSINKNAPEANKDRKGRKGGFVGESNCFRLVEMIMKNKFAPAVVFSFSKKECEAYAMQTAKLDFVVDEDKADMKKVYDAAMNCLSEENRKIPQVQQMLPLALKGIGIHHSGLLPIMREITEMLFDAGFIKILFTTETFAMGLNMPARTVLFTGTRKFDGNSFRYLTSGEYIQMSGRAGRRGLDDKGIVIMMMSSDMSYTDTKDMITGKSDPLNSSYRLTYSTIVNSIRQRFPTGMAPEDILERSFLHFQNYPQMCNIYDRLIRSEQKYLSYEFDDEVEVADYHFKKTEMERLKGELVPFIQKPKIVGGFLGYGRLLKVIIDGLNFGWCPVVKYKKPKLKSKAMNKTTDVRDDDERIEVLIQTLKKPGSSELVPCPPNTRGDGKVVTIKFSSIVSISAVQAKIPEKLEHSDERSAAIMVVENILRKFSNEPPEYGLDIKNEDFIKIHNKVKDLEEKLKSHALVSKEKSDVYQKFKEREQYYEEFQSIEQELIAMKAKLKMDELKKRKKILRKMGYIDNNEHILLKGAVLVDISCADELLLTEMIFDGFFNNLSVPDVCAALSCLIFSEQQKDAPKLTESLTSMHKRIQDMARKIGKESNQVGLNLDVDEYVESFRPEMMPVIYAWASKFPFHKLLELSSVYEGSIFRCVRRLYESLSEAQRVTSNMGAMYLEVKFVSGIPLILRDIMHTESLYRV